MSKYGIFFNNTERVALYYQQYMLNNLYSIIKVFLQYFINYSFFTCIFMFTFYN